MLTWVREQFRSWLEGPAPHSIEEELALQSIPMSEAYRCQDCHHVVFRAPQGRCRKCGSSAIDSLAGELQRLRQHLALFIHGYKEQQDTIEALRDRNQGLRAEKRQLAAQIRARLLSKSVGHGVVALRPRGR